KTIVGTFLFAAILTLATLALVYGRGNPVNDKSKDFPEAPGANLPASKSPPVLQEESTNNKMEVEVIALRPIGFEPDTITRPQGKFLLAVNNLTGLDEVTLQLDAETGARQHGEGLSRKHRA